MPERSSAALGVEPEEGLELDEIQGELVDVPAAVVCASCGDPDCPGCVGQEEHTQGSGVVAIVPWERPGLAFSSRLWTTSQLATRSCKAFFGALPDGELLSALRFAIACEVFAVLGLVVAAAPIVLLVAPWLGTVLIEDAGLRDLALRAFFCGVPGVALAMVFVHAVHGWGLDVGARRQGARPRKGRGLRFGLYACGWDLVTLPLGLLVVALTDGPRAALSTAPLGVTAPRHSSRAYLQGIHHLDPKQARDASRFAVLLATGVVVAAALLGLGALAMLVMSRA